MLGSGTGGASGCRAYILIDLASAPAALSDLLGSGKKSEHAINLLERDGVAGADAVAPWLVPVPASELGQQWMDRSWAIACQFPAVLWLSSTLSTEDLCDALVRRLALKHEDHSEWLFRYYDPRVFIEVVEAMKPHELQALLAPATNWSYLDRDGQFNTVASRGSRDEGWRDALPNPWLLGSEAEAALLLATEAGQVLHETFRLWPQDLERRTAMAQFQLAKRTCQEAELHGFDNLGDKVLLLMHSAESVDNYFDSAQWAQDLAEMRAKKFTLRQFMEALI